MTQDLKNEITEAIQTILNAVNGGNQKEVAETICTTIERDHRTLQQGFWSVMMQAQILYGHDAVDGVGFDERNKASVILAIAVHAAAREKNLDMGLPRI
jgi:hypothetical protein